MHINLKVYQRIQNMEQSFLKKYQPTKFADYSNFKDTIDILQSVTMNTLLVGEHGGGKTCLIKSIINEYYDMDNMPNNNILIISNLNDQGIQYYRNEVKTFCQIRSTIKGKKKIIVLDDMDLISDQSQQVFRNFLDNYSSNVLFLASCTRVQKIIESIQSRFFFLKMEKIEPQVLFFTFNKIVVGEKLTIDQPSKEFILTMCDNNIRLLINILEKIKIIDRVVNIKLANEICVNISFHEFEIITQHLKDDKFKEATAHMDKIYNKGYSVLDILTNYFVFIKKTTLIGEDTKYEIIKLLCKYTTIFHTIHEDEIELVFFLNELKKKLV